MNEEMKKAFSLVKPVCDRVMVYPSSETISAFSAKLSKLKKDPLQQLQQYIMFPLITHIQSTEIENKHDLQCLIVDAMASVLGRITIDSFEMCMKIETGLLPLIFDNSKNGMVADVPEELKYSVVKCLTTGILHLDHRFCPSFMKTQMPLLAQIIFVSVHIAKLEKLRALRVAAVNCVLAHTMMHKKQTDKQYRILDPALEKVVFEMLASILPGVLAALQDVAMCAENPGHAVIVASLNAIHRIMCFTMNDKFLSRKTEVTTDDFVKLFRDKLSSLSNDVSNKDKLKLMDKRSPEWFAMAGEKLTVVVKSLVGLRTHEHYKVRRELSLMCGRMLLECSRTMQPSMPLALDILISLSKDDHQEISQYCINTINAYFDNCTVETKHRTMDSLSENFFATLNALPRILNNIDSARKLSALNLLHGYIVVLCDSNRPQRLTTLLSLNNSQSLCDAILEAVSIDCRLASLAQHAVRDVRSPPPTNAPWCHLRHLESRESQARLREVLALLGEAECCEIILDTLLQTLPADRQCEVAFVANYMGSAPKAPPSLTHRVLTSHLNTELSLPIQISSQPLTDSTTWDKISVPDLYEGTVETRYTDISYATPRTAPPRDSNYCTNLSEAQKNITLLCLLNEGIGRLAKKLGEDFQPYLLRTLCMILERVGSPYESLHLSALTAINDIAIACSHKDVPELIRHNADYITSQIVTKLKKAWESESAMRILSVVMEFSDVGIMDCLYGIVQDVLLQSCDKYHNNNLLPYLQVFLAFTDCIKKWYPINIEAKPTQSSSKEAESSPLSPTSGEHESQNIAEDFLAWVKDSEDAQKLLDEDLERDSGKSVEEMYREDMKKKEENVLDYDDTVTAEKPPLPQHITLTITILKRTLNFVQSRNREECILALQILTKGLPLLSPYDDELLPLVHQSWGPMVAKFEAKEPIVLRRAFDLLIVMAELSKDFIRKRAANEVLPSIFNYLRSSAKESYLKDAGSAYRESHAYKLQLTALRALPTLVVNLLILGEELDGAMACVDAYISNRQPKALQSLGVDFFRKLLIYDYGATWSHLREFCGNDQTLLPPNIKETDLKLSSINGTPYEHLKTEFNGNLKLIFNHVDV